MMTINPLFPEMENHTLTLRQIAAEQKCQRQTTLSKKFIWKKLIKIYFSGMCFQEMQFQFSDRLLMFSSSCSPEDESSSSSSGSSSESSEYTRFSDLTRRQWATVAMLAVANLCSTIAFSCIAPFYPGEVSEKLYILWPRNVFDAYLNCWA